MKTGTLVNRLVLTLIGISLTLFYVGAAGQTLTVFDIPDQTINLGQSFSDITLDNYIDVPSNELSKIEWNVSGANQLSVNIDNSRKASIVPLSDTWTGSETITFHATDTNMNSGSDAAIFTINELANAAPVVTDIPDQQLAEGSSFQPVNLDNYVSDPDNPNEDLTWSASGNLSLSVDIDLTTHTATIDVPNIDWNGSETVVFKATDPGSESSEDAATFTLTPVNDPPVVGDILDQSINSGESFNTIPLDNYVTDVDNSKSELSWVVTGNTNLTPSVDGSHIATINQPANWSGSEKLTFTVNDPSNASASDDATFEAKAVNSAPVAVNDSYSTSQGATLNIAAPGVLSNDSDADLDPLTAIKVTDPLYGTLTLNSDGSFDYVNDGTASTTDAFTYKASDGTTESNIATVNISITLVNVPPVLGGIEGSSLDYTEGDGAVSITGTITVTDDDNASLASAVITISSNYQNGEDVLSFTNANGISGSWSAAGGQLTLSGNSSVANYQAALRSVKYTNSSVTPSSLARTVTFSVSDGTDNSNTQNRIINVTGTNNAPVLGGIEGSALVYTEGDGAVSITGTITATDADNASLASAVITISSNYQNGEDVLSFTNANGISGSWSAAGGQLTLSGNSSTANYQAALRSVKYTNSSVTPSSLARTVTFSVSDGTDNSNTQNRIINVTGTNNAPVLGGIEGSALVYTEGDGAVSITGTITATDADNASLASAVITISSNYQNGEDVLSFTNANGISGSWSAAGGQLTLSGNSSVANYQAALRSVKYTNSSVTPSSLARTVTFRVSDGTDNSNTQNRIINVTGTNNAPVLGGIEGSALVYTEGDGAVSITGTITATDADNASLASAVITISSNYQNGEDVLSFTNANGISGSWSAAGGQLTLSGNSSVANYQAALRSVKYTNSSVTPSSLARTVTFRVSDGTDNSNTQNRIINVTGTNSAPVLGGIEGSALVYTEGDGAVSITGTITATDADNASLASALITISSNYQNGEDVLSFTNANGISGSWSAAGGQLTLSGNSSTANYQAALRSVKYTNSSVTPSSLARTVTFRVSDGTDNSNTQNRNINVTGTNSAPVLGGIEGSALDYTEGDGAVSITGTITATDADNTSLASALITISANYQNGEDVLSFTNANGISGSWNATSGQLSLSGNATVANYRTALRAVKYTNSSVTPSSLARTVTFRVSDGTDNSNTQSRNINVTGTNSAPVLGGIEGSALGYTEGDGAVSITGTITATDADNTSLASALITISSNYQNGEDVLSFTNANGISGSWNAAAGQLSLSGNATVANYRTALRAVKYTNSSVTPSSLARTVTFRVNDGTDNSNTQSRNINMTGTNSAPVLGGIEGSSLDYTEGDGVVSITGTITVTDADNTSLASALITISANYQNGEDVLSFTNANGISGSWSAAGGQLTLSGNSSIANYQAALRSVKYTNSSITPNILARTITFRVSDGTDNSNTQSRNINVTGTNSAPVLGGIEGSALGYTEGDGAVSITGTITATDADNTSLASALITISANYQNGEDVLSFTNANGISGSWNAASGQLSLSGIATVANYRTALRAVKYTNNSVTPSSLTRTVTFRVSDGTDNSNTQSRNINMTGTNSAPVLGGIEGSALVFTEGDAAVNITGTITATDEDNISLASALITISANYQNGEDVLSFTNANGISGSWNAAGGQLTLSGNSSIANYQAALRSVKYTNSSGTPGILARTVTFRVSDGTDNSNTQSRNISIVAVNDPPVLAGIETTDLDYTEGDGPVSVSGSITVTDIDDLTLHSAIISISANYKNAQDVLSYTNANGITGSWNVATGELTLTGNVSPANYQTALRSVKYTNTSNNPNTAARTVTFRVNDGTVNSNLQSRTITITRIGVFSGNISGSASYCVSSVMPIVLTVTDGTAPFTATLTRTGSILNKDTVITGIVASPYTINVKLTGSYVLSNLTDVNNENATVTPTPVVLTIFPKPSGVLSGGAALCNDGVAKSNVTVNFTGTSPWTFTIRRGNAGNDTTFTGITNDPYTFNTRITTSPMSVRLIAISDAHCTGDTIGSGTLRISYLPSPNAVIQGQDTICPGGTGNLKVTVTGAPGPWTVTYLKDGANPTDINVGISPYTLGVQGTGNYSLSKVKQQVTGGCTGRVSGTGKIISFTVPTATISGSSSFCEYTTGNLNVNLTGNSPWKYSYKINSESPVEVLNVSSSPNTLPINTGGTYTLVEVFDMNCKGTTSGSANITITPAPLVSLSGLAPAYDKEYALMVPISGTPAGGTFTGSTGLFNSNENWYFLPRYAPVGTQHIVYSYKDLTTQCFGYDTATVRVLEADAIIEFPENRLKYCRNEDPFNIIGVNLANNIGSFTITGGAGLVDHGNDTATVYPSQLSVKEYTITYSYFDGTILNVTSTFEVGKSPEADFKWESECYEQGQSIQFNDASIANFGNISAYHWKVYTSTGFDTASTKNINYTFPEPGNHQVELQVETSYGCSGTISKVFGLRPTIPLKGLVVNESFEGDALSWRSGTPVTPAVNSWTLGTPAATDEINHAASGSKCWYTKFPSTNAPQEDSWVSSPCYDFTGMNRPMVKMQIWRDFNGRRDGTNLQATTDSAKSWFNIGQMDDGQNWYNEYLILGNPGNQQTGWSDVQDGGWKEARHSLDMLKGKKKVQFRIAYGSDGTVQNTEGFAFDDFWIGERNRMVLIEHFTNASDEASQVADAKLNALVDADSLNTIDLQYHTYFPGYDPFYEKEPYAPRSRLLYYGVLDVPYGILNGGYKTGYRFDYAPANDKEDTTLVHLESLNDAAFDLKFLSSSFSGDQVLFVLQIDANIVLPAHEYTVHAGVIERKVAGTGSNGGTIYQNVVRGLLPGTEGITISGAWPAGSQQNYSYQWDIPSGITRDQLMAFAFMQDEETHEVYQVNKVKIGFATATNHVLPGSSRDKFIVFPNPARDQAFIRFEEPVQGDVRIEMFNSLGSLVYTEIISQTDTDSEIMTDKYPDGLYIIRVTAGNELLGVTRLNITR